MKKVTTLVLMLCLTLSGALCYAHGTARTENKKSEGIILEVKNAALHGSSDKSGSIVPTLNGHVLTVAFTENLGDVIVEISTAAGGNVQVDSCSTPNGLVFLIPFAGDYIVTFTLPNGDEYYGEFTVTD